jgi:radical SAM protein with 4Fe4S-binding SPASM domain
MIKLQSVAFHLTYYCENKCPYCYIGNENRQTHPPFEKVKNVIEKLAEGEVEKIFLVGGDPCSYPNLKDIIKLIKKLGLKVYILSNTLNFNRDFDFFVNNIDGFEATVLGSTPQEHDIEAKRKGAYDFLINNIKRLNRNGKGIKICLSLHTGNFNKVLKIVKNLIENEKINVRKLGIQRIIPRGRALNSLEYCLTKEQVNFIFEQLHKIRNDYNLNIDIKDPFPLCIVDKKYQYLQTNSCKDGFEIGSINFNGDMSRCGADTRFSLGNILKIRDLQQFWNNNPILVDFRSRKWLPERCQKCKLLEKCGGGCPLSRCTEKDHDLDILFPHNRKT